MKLIWVLPLLAIPIILFGHTSAHATLGCQPHTICVHPGDYLKYHASLGKTNSTETYIFGNMTDQQNISVSESYFSNSQNQNVTFTLNLDTGYGRSEQSNTTNISFIPVLPTPISYNETDIAVSKGLKDFNGFERTVITALVVTDNGSSTLEYDSDTGVLLKAYSIQFTKISGKPVVLEFSNSLVDTNLINSNSTIQSGKVVIPSWIKNTAKWWSDGSIGDNEFVKAIQYLISNGIMQVPHNSSVNSSSQEIPMWIKNNAGWWAEGKISDNDFVSGIQYLINSGIVKA